MSNKQQINEGAKPQTTTVIRGVTPQIQSDRPTVTGGVQPQTAPATTGQQGTKPPASK